MKEDATDSAAAIVPSQPASSFLSRAEPYELSDACWLSREMPRWTVRLGSGSSIELGIIARYAIDVYGLSEAQLQAVHG